MSARPLFDASGAFVARTDFTHDGVEVRAGARFDVSKLSTFDVAVLWRAMLIDNDVAGPAAPSPAVSFKATTGERVEFTPPPKKRPRAAPSGV
jgi:hypothetical protein